MTAEFYTDALQWGTERQGKDVGEDFASWAFLQVVDRGNPADIAALWKSYILKDYQERHFVKPKTKSLDAPVSEENDTQWHEVLADPNAEVLPDEDFDPESDIDMNAVRRRALELMPEKERALMQMRLMGFRKGLVLRLATNRGRKQNSRRTPRSPLTIGYDNYRRMLHRWRAAMASAYASELASHVKDNEIDTGLEIAWVTIP